ncbi:MAG: YetF domain-containing protein [Pseudomonadota bacterium]
MDWFNIEYGEILKLTVSPLELMLRGTLMFWFLFFIFRFILRRDVGSMGVSDFLFVVILGDAAQNAMIGEGSSTSDGMVLIATLVFWNYGIDYVTYRFPALERFAALKKLCLVRDGKLIRRNMRRELITSEELKAKLREEGLESLADVKLMYLEADGEISVIKRDS